MHWRRTRPGRPASAVRGNQSQSDPNRSGSSERPTGRGLGSSAGSLHTVHAIAAERFGEHPEHHKQVFQFPTRIDPNRIDLQARLQQSLVLSQNARYLDGGGSSAARWFEPYHVSSDDAVDEGMTIMRTLNPELRRLVGWPYP